MLFFFYIHGQRRTLLFTFVATIFFKDADAVRDRIAEALSDQHRPATFDATMEKAARTPLPDAVSDVAAAESANAMVAPQDTGMQQQQQPPAPGVAGVPPVVLIGVLVALLAALLFRVLSS